MGNVPTLYLASKVIVLDLGSQSPVWDLVGLSPPFTQPEPANFSLNYPSLGRGRDLRHPSWRRSLRQTAVVTEGRSAGPGTVASALQMQRVWPGRQGCGCTAAPVHALLSGHTDGPTSEPRTRHLPEVMGPGSHQRQI